ncbi:SPOR domain-containing protein [Alicycliphilus denitrificans]|uniref:Sporulation domain-containing protein n=2 Tax=Alicycliphilus denitrificans TaxID=179636 RepID=F4G983_ALIDK|nr:SPOR domain-containing protein [Alicycliphilus denitrificans]OJW95038.1 MAG: sporulation protein [Alicycliphilus sp. 69-12]GAO25378.1 sporulation domain-containing protein [Alicycliphilus sp. B1]ADV01789.1 Sporulation domain-containing protein [Alicycliphilus denitrificans BC]AEB86742.1 Sporulation domain-containing protein [Alicycliphilus denitrificans K601]MBN9575274.1 SPOR domain-containing protein [Alicycliphilus denitrificans]
MKKQQRGGTIVGFILGVIVGLGAALAVAVYVTKVPIPFLNKNATRASDQDEAQRNKNWDPNAPLYGKNPARPAAPASAPEGAAVATPAEPASAAAPVPRTADNRTAASQPSADPLGDLARAKANAAPAPAGADPFQYFVQAGAFRTQQDADAQRAKLAMLGWEARVSERETNGRTVFRVRVGPFAKRDDAEALKEKLDGAGVDSALVRVQR